MGRIERRPLLAGDHHQRMGFAGLSALGGQQGIGIGPRHQPVGDQHIENLGRLSRCSWVAKVAWLDMEFRLGRRATPERRRPPEYPVRRVLSRHDDAGALSAAFHPRLVAVSAETMATCPGPLRPGQPTLGPRLSGQASGPRSGNIPPRPQRSQGCAGRRNAPAPPAGHCPLPGPKDGPRSKPRSGRRSGWRSRHCSWPVRNRGAAVEDAG